MHRNSNELFELSSIESERAFNGGITIDPESLLFLNPKPKPIDFYWSETREYFEVLEYLFEKHRTFDLVMIDEEIKNRGKADLLPPTYTGELTLATPTSIHNQFYANLVIKYSTHRHLVIVATGMAQAAWDINIDISDTLGKGQLDLLAVGEDTEPSDGLRRLDSYNDAYYERLEKAKTGSIGYETGIKQLDKDLSGLQKKHLYILAGRPGIGKSSLGLDMAAEGIPKGEHIAVFSLEMAGERVHNSIVSHVSGVNNKRTWSGRDEYGNGITEAEWQAIIGATSLFSAYEMYIDDKPAITVSELRSKAIKFKAKVGSIGLLVVDYLQLMRAGNGRYENRQVEVSIIAQSLKNLAKELNCPILALSQLSRAVEGRAGGVPILSDLRESGAIEQAADGVIFEYYEDEASKAAGLLNLILAKNRFGPTGLYSVVHEKTTGRFSDTGEQQVKDKALADAHHSNSNNGAGSPDFYKATNGNGNGHQNGKKQLVADIPFG